MRESIAHLRHNLVSADDLHAVVNGMKVIASSNIDQYEKTVLALDRYYVTIELGLSACLSLSTPAVQTQKRAAEKLSVGAIVFGSNQGLVGQFNESMVKFVKASLAELSAEVIIWAMGERMHARLQESALRVQQCFVLPHSMQAITTQVSDLLIAIENQRQQEGMDHVYLFHHRPDSQQIFKPVKQALLPLDAPWQQKIALTPWPENRTVEVLPVEEHTRQVFIREYLFICLYRAFAESLMCENASRLAAMQRAEKNIDELMDTLSHTLNRLRKSAIDEELFDVLSGFYALNKSV